MEIITKQVNGKTIVVILTEVGEALGCPTTVVSPSGEPVDYSQSHLAAAYRDAPPFVQRAIAASWPVALWGEAAAIIYCESGNNPDAEVDNDVEHSIGLMQVNVRAHPNLSGDLKDANYNVKVGYTIYQASNSWTPWLNCAKRLGLL